MSSGPPTEAAVTARGAVPQPGVMRRGDQRLDHPSSNVVTPNTRSRRSGRIGPVYMRAVSNTGASPWACASATASRLTLGTSRKTSSPPAAADAQAREHRLGGGAVVGNQRPDLVAGAARADHAPGGEPAVANERAADMPARSRSRRAGTPRAAPETPWRRPPRWPRTQRPSSATTPAGGAAGRRDRAAVADIGIGEHESRFLVVLLLRHHAVEADGARRPHARPRRSRCAAHGRGRADPAARCRSRGRRTLSS